MKLTPRRNILELAVQSGVGIHLRLVALMISFNVLVFSSESRGVNIDTVFVGLPGNPPDVNHFGDGQFGSVPYSYRIGKFEVTNDQYADFLNSVARIDSHNLFGGLSGIDRSNTPTGFSYAAKPNAGNKPVAGVSFWDAARFANWLHNGQPVGEQDNSTTEDGAYGLAGITNPPIASVFRKVDAQWVIPNENEWYKAAYYQPRELGGDADDYWKFPTASNTELIPAKSDEFGNIINPGPNIANMGVHWNFDHAVGQLTTVGSAGSLSASFFGTFDQAGNLTEWLEDIHNFSPNTRVVRGGDWIAAKDPAAAWYRNGGSPNEEKDTVGFRIARLIPEPSTFLLCVLATVVSCHRRRR